MFRIGFVFFCLVMLSCNNKKKKSTEDAGFSYELFSEGFKVVTPSYQLTDTGLLRNRDTNSVQSPKFVQFISDSVRNKIFGKGAKVKYVPLARINAADGVSYYIIKGVSGSKRAALMLVFNKDQFGNLFPFLVPDTDPATSQSSSIDKSGSITRLVTKRKTNNIWAEGKEVFVYDAPSTQFALILVNPLDMGDAAVINPIDTLPRKHKFAGDYIKDSRNFISVRDGRYPNQLMVYIHLDKKDPECNGELKGDILLTSSTAAIYRQGGDPCVLSFRFSSNSVTVKEDEGCGSHHGLDCVFDGTYQRKKEAKSKTTTKKKKSK